MNTQENNRLIAEFMEYPELGTEGDFSYLKYHKEWYWLMPVVDKIEDRTATWMRYGTKRINSLAWSLHRC